MVVNGLGQGGGAAGRRARGSWGREVGRVGVAARCAGLRIVGTCPSGGRSSSLVTGYFSWFNSNKHSIVELISLRRRGFFLLPKFKGLYLVSAEAKIHHVDLHTPHFPPTPPAAAAAAPTFVRAISNTCFEHRRAVKMTLLFPLP